MPFLGVKRTAKAQSLHSDTDCKSSIILVSIQLLSYLFGSTMAGGMFVKSAVLTVLSVGLISINSLSLAAVLKSKELQKQHTTPFLISLFVADLLQGVLGSGVSAVLSWADVKDMNNLLKQFHTFGLYLFPAASLTSVAALATVKMVTVVWPLRISDLITKKKTIFLLIFIWIIPISFSVLQFFGDEPVFDYSNKTSWESSKYSWITKIAIFVIFLPCFLILSGSYITVFIVVIKQTIKIRKQTAPSAEDGAQMPNLILTAFKSSKSIIAVVTIYFLGYIGPSIFFNVTVGNSNETTRGYIFWLFWLPYTESIFNSLIYICLNKAAKNELKKMFSLNSKDSV